MSEMKPQTAKEFLESKKIFGSYIVADENAPENYHRLSELLDEYRNQSRWIMPTDKQLIEIAILFSEEKGVVNKLELANMVAMAQFILNRLAENNDVMIPAKSELPKGESND